MKPRLDSSESTWSCHVCGDLIRRRADPPLGTPYYEHIEPVIIGHMAVRGPANG